MPVLECSRCNELSYSAARPLDHKCGRCGSDRHRCFEVGNRLDRVRAMVRQLGQGDHLPAGVADWCARYIITAERTPIRIVDGLDASSAAALDPDQWRLLERRAHEELFDGQVSAICLYDSSTLGPEFLATATATHPLVAREGKLWRNEDFVYEPAPA